MFAPPSPIPGNRPLSAAGHHAYPFQQSHSPLPQEQRLHRSDSFSWKHELGLPPPPSQIDALGDALNNALVPHSRPASRARSKSPAARSPSRYDLEFGGAQDPVEQSERTQDHMNMVTKHPKVKIDVILSSNTFEAGGAVSGKVELTCTTSQRLRIGQIAIELEAVEQLTSRDHAATQLFLYNRTMFQGDNLPPSNAVLPAAPVNGYWTARKGRTTFPFSFRLPSSAPSCVTFAGNASLRYGLKATVQTWYNEDKMIVTARREAFILEKWADEHHPRFREPVEAVGDARLFMGGNGAVWLEAGVTEQLFWAGGQMLVRCGVKNNTKRHLAGIKVALARRLVFPVGSAEGLHDSPDKVSLEPRITEIVHDQVFKGREYEFAPNAESVCTVAVDIPKDLRTIRKTRLFEVRTFALVSLLLGSFAKDLTIEIPVYVAHTASGQQAAQPTLDNLHTRLPLNSLPQRPHSSIGHSHFSHPEQTQHRRQQLHHHHQLHQHHAQSALPLQDHQGHRILQTDPGMLEVERVAAERGWSPAPMHDAGRHIGLDRPASTAPGMIQLPLQAQPFTVAPDGRLEWNQTANSWNASRFMAPTDVVGQSIQRSVSAAPDMFHDVAHLQIASPSLAGAADPVTASIASHQSMSTSPGPVAMASLDNLAAHAQGLGMSSPHIADGAYVGNHQMSHQSQAPSSDDSHPHAGPARESLPDMLEPQIIAGSASEQQQYTVSPSQLPMNAFSAAGGAPAIAGLATIDEDGESQAGTIKTLQKLPTIGKTSSRDPKGNSVSRNNIEQFEAMAEAGEDDEEVKRQMIAMGMQPDEDAFSSRGASCQVVANSPVPAAVSDASVAAVATSTNRPAEASQTSSTGTYRPRASDIFQTVAQPELTRVPSAVPAPRQGTAVETTSTHAAHSASKASTSEFGQAGADQVATTRRPSVVSLRRSSSSHGIGLQALETNLVRSTTPKISSTSLPIVTIGNAARGDIGPSSLASPSVGHDDRTRSRKNSALRAAALAREDAERKLAEQEAQEAEQRERQLRAEKARQAEAAEKEAAQREADRIHAVEQRRQERERIAEHARRQRELREQEEEQRLKAEAERVEREQQLKLQEQEQVERRSRRAAEAAAASTRDNVEDATRKLANVAVTDTTASSGRLERVKAAIANAPSSIAPSVPSKTTAPAFVAPGRTNDRDRAALKRQAVHRIDGWLSNAANPNLSHMETPGTPSASVLSAMRKDESAASHMRNHEARSSFPYRSPSQVINPLWDCKSAGSKAIEGSGFMPRSRTMVDLATSRNSTVTVQTTSPMRDEPVPQLSDELRALVDSSEIRPARKSGTALKEHPISRRLSGMGGSTDKTTSVELSTRSVSQAFSQLNREGHSSAPGWARPGLLVGNGKDEARGVNASAFASSNSVANMTNTAERRFPRRSETYLAGIPTSVEKSLRATAAEETTGGKEEASYDARSARGGRGGRVASATQLWSKIAGDDDVTAAEAGNGSLAAPQTESQPRSASPSSASTVKPKARRSSSAAGGAPALDFSKKALTSSASVGVTAIAASFGGAANGTKPESLKSFTAPQFLNTSAPKPVFAKVSDQPASSPGIKPEKRPLPKPVLQPGAVPAPQLVRPTAMRAQKAPAAERPSRRISTQLLSTFEKDKTLKSNSPNDPAVREMVNKVAVDSTILSALQGVDANTGHEFSSLRCADGSEIKMSGRGTTKAIGENKLKSLRAVWGS